MKPDPLTSRPGDRKAFRGAASPVVALLIAGSLSACVDLNVPNLNEPDAERALSNAGDVASLISGSYYSWFMGTHYAQNWSVGTPGLFLSNMAFQHASPWANFGMWWLSAIPRKSIENDVSWGYYGNYAFAWDNAYRALSSIANGLTALEDSEVSGAFTPEELLRYRAFGRFVQGLALGTVALLYEEGFVVDETTDLTKRQTPQDYGALMAAALGYLEDAIDLSTGADFEIPFDWMKAEVDSEGLIRLAHSTKARLRAQVARTPQERAAVDWSAVIQDVDAGIGSTQLIHCDWPAGWECFFLWIATRRGWGQLPYFIYGMADQSGDVLEWLDLPIEEKTPRFADGRPVRIVTPDLRFPQGSTIEEQRLNEGRFFRVQDDGESVWRNPERGVWRWSWYMAGYGRGLDYGELDQRDQPETTLEEMRLLKAEGLFRQGSLGAAAAIINETRVAAGLSPTDASGTNESCVPRLPDGSCGDLWEMLKWEKRMETVWTGIAGVNWYLDGRGWGDLWRDTPLHLPLPCGEAELLLLPCKTVGGPAGPMGSPGSVYEFPFEGAAGYSVGGSR